LVANKEKNFLISGKFAVIHSGHIRLFIFAKTIGKRLTVAIDVDGLSNEEREFRIDFLKNVMVMSGAGVGGGSLVYANTLYRPPVEFFKTGSWAGITDWQKLSTAIS
jgi:hypothetical protein